MFKANLVVIAVTLMFAGAVQAEATEKQFDARVAVATKKAAPAAIDAQTRAAAKKNNAANEELHPDARPVYLNGGHFGDN